ncbi:MAG: hypothetical protein U5R06_19640 [candidate division KSB1 bacterium]|nr:hypothetical protein [candidate division KSB1 bacterium]
MNNRSIPLQERTLYIPQMSYEGAACMAAAFRSIGVNARPSPASDAKTLESARKVLSGDECLPQAVVLGNFLQVTEMPDYDPDHTAFMLPTSNGPCRFGHYMPLCRKIFADREENVMICSPTSTNGYQDIGEEAQNLVRTGWQAVVASDCLRKLYLITRPYELNPGDADRVFEQSLKELCSAIEVRALPHSQRLSEIVNVLSAAREAFRGIPADYSQDKLIIGVVGEIFCRFNSFSNQDMFRHIEKYNGVVWISDIAEWVWYTHDEEEMRLKDTGQTWSFQMLGCKIKQAVMHHDEKKITNVFKDDFKNVPEPHHVREILELSRPYLPREGSNGEMVMSMGKALWYYHHGAAGVIDISPFSCMNGIVTEAVYPRVCQEHNNFPVRVFYFDGNQASVENDLELFMELARQYQNANIKE